MTSGSIVASLESCLNLLTKSNSDETPADFKVFSYNSDFDKLWSIDLTEGASTGFMVFPNIIIINDGIPDLSLPGIPSELYFSPYEWAVQLALKQAKNDKEEIPNIIILELKSSNEVQSLGSRFFRQFGSGVPWISICKKINTALVDTVSSLSYKKKQIADFDMDLLRQFWAANILNPNLANGRHNLANAIGPMIISRSRDGATKGQKILLQYIETIESTLGPEESENRKNEEVWVDLGLGWSSSQQKMDFNIILVDDNAFTTGWASFVCSAFGLGYDVPEGTGPTLVSKTIGGMTSVSNSSVRVIASATPDFLLDPIPRSDGPFKVTLFPDGSNSGEILFLDLRLFSSEGMIENEFHFFKTLISKAKHFECGSKDPTRSRRQPTKIFPWPGFSSEEIVVAEKWLKEADSDRSNVLRNTNEYYSLLSFLARLIALSDYSLPIVIFSSSGQKGILKHFVGYGSIFTDFQKPGILGWGGSASLEEARSQFQRVFKGCMELSCLRQKAKRVYSKLTLSSENEKEEQQKIQAGSHIDIFIDESGSEDKKLTLGGICAIYPPGASQVRFNNKLKSLIMSDILWDEETEELTSGKNLGTLIFTSLGKDRLRRNISKVSSEIIKVCQEQSVEIFSFFVHGKQGGNVPRDEDLLRNVGYLDNIYRELFKTAIESILFYKIRSLLEDGAQITFSVVSDKRSREIEFIARSLFGSMEEVSERDINKAKGVLLEGLGLETFEGQYNKVKRRKEILVKLINSSTPRYFVEELFRRYEGCDYKPRSIIVRAKQLCRMDEKGGNIEVLHALADAFLDARFDKSVPLVERLGLKLNNAQPTLGLLKAARNFSNNRVKEAVGVVLADEVSSKQFSKEAVKLFGPSIIQAFDELPGADFMKMI